MNRAKMKTIVSRIIVILLVVGLIATPVISILYTMQQQRAVNEYNEMLSQLGVTDDSQVIYNEDGSITINGGSQAGEGE